MVLCNNIIACRCRWYDWVFFDIIWCYWVVMVIVVLVGRIIIALHAHKCHNTLLGTDTCSLTEGQNLTCDCYKRMDAQKVSKYT